MQEYKKYEAIIIVDSKFNEEAMDELISTRYGKEIIAEYNEPVNKIRFDGKEDIEVNKMGLKKLAYEVKGHTDGYFYQFTFWATKDNIDELERIFRIDDRILKFMIIKCNSDPEVVALDDDAVASFNKSEQPSPGSSHPKINLMDILLADDTDV